MNYNTVSAALVAVPNRSIMRISHFFVLTVLISTALAWPRQRQSALTMEEGALEEALSRRGYAHSNARRPNAWGQQSGLGLVEGVCKSVKADTSFLGTTTHNLVHFCEERKLKRLASEHVQERIDVDVVRTGVYNAKAGVYNSLHRYMEGVGCLKIKK